MKGAWKRHPRGCHLQDLMSDNVPEAGAPSGKQGGRAKPTEEDLRVHDPERPRGHGQESKKF